MDEEIDVALEESNIVDEIDFIETDAEVITSELISDFEEAYGEQLYPADERRIFIQALSYIIADQLIHINETGRENLLRYASENKLDALGDFFINSRLKANYAKTTIKFVLSAIQTSNTIIPKGTRVTPDGELFFATDNDLIFYGGASELEKEVSATATIAGSSHNDFMIGQIDKLVDGNPYIEGVANTTVSAGGSDIESDDDYRNRLRISPFSLAVAGPSQAYEAIALSSSVEVGDVRAYSPSAGVVEIAVIKDDGEIPSADDEILNIILNACSDKDRRPLTDNVRVIPAIAADIEIQVDYYIPNEDYSNVAKIMESVEEYKSWQTEKIGRDINPDKLRQLMFNAGAAKIDIITPVYRKLEKNEVAKIGQVTVNLKGSITV